MAGTNKRQSKKLRIIVVALAALTLINVSWLIFNVYTLNNYKNYTGDCKVINSKRVCTGAYVGLTEKQALEKAETSGLSARVVRRDAESIFITDDLNPHRLNFSIKDNVVIATEFY